LNDRQSIVGIVEDDASMRRSVRRLLNAHGYATEEFVSAEEFLTRRIASRAACLVLDVHLEGMSGIELCRELTASGYRLPVIFITAIDRDDQEREAVEAECAAYLHKPFAAESLLAAIDRVLVDPDIVLSNVQTL
jgi:FixJ family two-component response regulator